MERIGVKLDDKAGKGTEHEGHRFFNPIKIDSHDAEKGFCLGVAASVQDSATVVLCFVMISDFFQRLCFIKVDRANSPCLQCCSKSVVSRENRCSKAASLLELVSPLLISNNGQDWPPSKQRSCEGVLFHALSNFREYSHYGFVVMSYALFMVTQFVQEMEEGVWSMFIGQPFVDIPKSWHF